MSDVGWISPILTAARPHAVAALLRNFRDLDLAEEVFEANPGGAYEIRPVATFDPGKVAS